MSLLEKAKRDIEKISSNLNEFARSALFQAPSGETAIVNIIHTKHHLGVDAELQKWANVKNAHISVSEKFLTDAGYPVRNSEGKVFLERHKVTVKDSTGQDCTYVVEQWFPNETIGLITCILGDYKYS